MHTQNVGHAYPMRRAIDWPTHGYVKQHKRLMHPESRKPAGLQETMHKLCLEMSYVSA